MTRAGLIETVNYQVLDSMLLNEVQKQNATIMAQKEKLQSLEERLARLESLLERTTSVATRGSEFCTGTWPGTAGGYLALT
jgi:hypothetical protein